MNVERVMGIEPTQLAWKARALPLSYTRNIMERETGLGPATFAMARRCSSQLSYSRVIAGAGDET